MRPLNTKKTYRLYTVFPFWWRVFNPTTILGHPGPFMRWLQLPLVKQNFFLLYQKQEGDRWLLPWATFHSFDESIALSQLVGWASTGVNKDGELKSTFLPTFVVGPAPAEGYFTLCHIKKFLQLFFHRNNQAFLWVHLHPLASKRLK